MSESDVYGQWRDMAAKAREIVEDPSIPLWQKAFKIPGAYQGLELNELRSKHRHKILNTLKEMNKILAPYQFTSFEDYHVMSDKEIQNIILLAKQLAPQ